MEANTVDMTGLKQVMAQKIMENRQTDIKASEPRVGPVNSKSPKRFYTTKIRCSQFG